MARHVWSAGLLSILLVGGCSHDLDSLRAEDASAPPRDSGGRDSGGLDSGGLDSGGRDSGGLDSGAPDSDRDSGGPDPCAGATTGFEAASAPPTATPTMGLLVGGSDRLNVWRFQLTSPLRVHEMGFAGTKQEAGQLEVAIVELADGTSDPPRPPLPSARVGPIRFDHGTRAGATDFNFLAGDVCLSPGWYAVTVTAPDTASVARISGGHGTDTAGPGRPYVRTSGGTSTQGGDARLFVRGQR